ncbi:GumC family protein [Altererythrobacter sp. MTPC7]|uniref:GumC family protein n=1 Tax=Altererythrobacter sp. MTPC7 TaxID=3056567 RepID=UPI0036F1CCD4
MNMMTALGPQEEATDSAVTPPRRLVRAARWLRDGLPSVGRYRRYIAALAFPLAAIWGLALAVLAFAPDRYDSTMTLILPGSGVGGSINLESIGQASSSTNSAFASSTLSPTENYKRLLMSDRVTGKAARALGEEPAAFPQPSIKLVDQTNLIAVQMPGATPEQARARTEAVRTAFLDALDALRSDEFATREDADQARIAELDAKVAQAQQKLLAFQGRTGLVSLDQFASRISTLDTLKDRERMARVSARQSAAMSGRLAATLGVSTGTANRALRLQSDPVFTGLLERYADIATENAEQGATLGPAHARMEELQAEKSELLGELARRGNTLAGLNRATVMKFADLAVSGNRAALFETLMTRDSDGAGSKAALSEIRRQIGEQSAQKGTMVRHAAELTELTRELRVAEAVFSSALARLDTNKSDPYASYPLVQTLEVPSLPRAKASPQPLLVLGGAAGATFLLLTGFLLLWLRQPIIRKLLPNA